MTRTIKTDEAYAAIAYRKTIIHDLITYLHRQYVGVDSDPKCKLICEDVFQIDSIVPVEEVIRVIEDLTEEDARLKLELDKFEFTRKDNDKPKERPKEQPKGAPAIRKTKVRKAKKENPLN